MESEMLTTDQAAAHVGVSSDVFRQWRAKGSAPPGYRVGPATWRYRRSELDAWLAERRVGGEPDPLLEPVSDPAPDPAPDPVEIP